MRETSHVRSYPARAIPTPRLPPRSTLYRLDPDGLGAERVESLTSYVSRLAAAHLVKPTWLLKSASIDVPSKGARALNGLCTTTVMAVHALEELTQVSDLAALTLLPWKGVFSSVNSLAATQRWCPRCLADWQRRGAVVCYPLLWSITTVRWCELHQSRLVSRCPNRDCASAVDLLAPPGRCSRCFAWLGCDSPDGSDDLNEDPDSWFTHATAQVLKRGQREGGLPAPEDMRAISLWLFEVVGNGRWESLRKRLGLSSAIIYSWRTGKALPSLEMFLTLCSRLNLEPDDLLDADRLKRLDPIVIRCASGAHARAAPRKPNEHPDLEFLRMHLEAALQVPLPFTPSLDQVAGDVGVGCELIRYHFPDLAKAVSLRRQVRTRSSARPINGGVVLR